jgi:hypothetical protein
VRQVGVFIKGSVARNLLLSCDEGGLWAGSGGSAAVSFQSRLLTGYRGQNPAPFFELYIAAKPFMGNLFFRQLPYNSDHHLRMAIMSGANASPTGRSQKAIRSNAR